jgi:hypothetical protein
VALLKLEDSPRSLNLTRADLVASALEVFAVDAFALLYTTITVVDWLRSLAWWLL